MALFDRSIPINVDRQAPLVFQAISWHAEDMDVDIEDGDILEQTQEYLIKAFGMNEKDETVSLTIRGFTPYFYVKVPMAVSETWHDRHLTLFRTYLIQKLPKSLRGQLKRVKYVQKRDMWGFSNMQLFKFIRLDFASLKAFRAAVRALEAPCSIQQLSATPIRFTLYESNIDPYIRFMHLGNIQPCGWIEVQAAALGKEDVLLPSSCQVDMETHWQNVRGVQKDTMARFLVASFDIECMSETGDFPVAHRDYSKLANALCVLYNRNGGAAWKEYDAKTRMLNCIKSALGLGEEIALECPRLPLRTSCLPSVEEVAAYVDDVYTLLKANPPKTASVKIREFLDKHLPPLEGDAVIQIGTTFHVYGDSECSFKHIVTLGSCTAIDGACVVECQTERALLLEWSKLIQSTNPDIICGYNIFGFDMAYMVDRAKELGCAESFLNLGRLLHRECTPATHFQERRLSSSALGDNILRYIVMEGRVSIDVMKCIQRDHKLDSYKLDNVAHTFMGMNKNDVSPADIFRLQRGTAEDRRIVADYCIQDCALCNHLIMKLEILANNVGMANVCLVPLSFIFMRGQGIKIFSLVLKQCKENGYLIPVITKPAILVIQIWDTDAAERLTAFLKGGSHWRIEDYRVLRASTVSSSNDTTFIVVYNHRDAVRMMTQDVLSKQLYMSKESYTVVESDCEYKKTVDEWTAKLTVKIGSKGTNMVTELPNILSVRERDEAMEEDGYEGAIVLDPEEGIYMNTPVSVLDYASLYPSSMISENLSHDSIVLDKSYDNLPGVQYLDIAYDVYEGTGDKKHKVGERTCRYAQSSNGEKGLIPNILLKLLKERKATRKRMQMRRVLTADGQQYVGFWNRDQQILTTEQGQVHALQAAGVQRDEPAFDSFQLAILDGLQLAYKITANSLYGQVGARTSPIYLKDIAACTTATGRKMILMAKTFLENEYGNGAHIIYGDTDSVFVAFDNKDAATGETLTGAAAVKRSIEHAHAASHIFKKYLKQPHDLEYDKTFYPFILLSKKRYVGNLYEEDETKCNQKSMGIVLKRRDNAPIVKHIYGGIIDILLNQHDLEASVRFLESQLQNMVAGKCPLDDLVVTKSLKADYKDPDRIAHKVLADRIGERDPGNRPQVNDRIPYVYVQQPAVTKSNKPVLQGNRIETPQYIQANKLLPDYGFYITNQIMRPILQIYALVVEKLHCFRKPQDTFEKAKLKLMTQYEGNPHKVKDKLQELREREAQELLFDPVLRLLEQKRTGQRSIADFMKPR